MKLSRKERQEGGGEPEIGELLHSETNLKSY
jgi:hypothetical protein